MRAYLSLVLMIITLPLAAMAETMTVTISPTYDNPPFRVGGVDINFKKYDMQRYREGAEWNWTINFCEVYASGKLVAKIESEKMEAGREFSLAAGGKMVRVVIKDMPKVTRLMECRGPVQPCWTQSGAVTRAKTITLEISVTPMGG